MATDDNAARCGTRPREPGLIAKVPPPGTAPRERGAVLIRRCGQATESATLMLPRVAFEYGQTWWAFSMSA